MKQFLLAVLTQPKKTNKQQSCLAKLACWQFVTMELQPLIIVQHSHHCDTVDAMHTYNANYNTPTWKHSKLKRLEKKKWRSWGLFPSVSVKLL